MKYNISDTDILLSKQMETKEGKQLYESLMGKISELELQLDFFKESVTHCNKNIEISTQRIQNEANNRKIIELSKIKSAFEDNKIIWNISGFITLLSIDIKTIQVGLYFAKSEWQKRFYARQACTIIYEAHKDIFKLLGKDFKEIITKRIDINSFETELVSVRRELNELNSELDYLSMVRNNTSAHKDKDILNQLNVISDINWINTIELLARLEKIINSLGDFMSKIIKLGIERFKT